MTEHSDAALIERYLELRDWIASESEKHDEKIKPYQLGMEAIEDEFLRRFNARVPDPSSKANSATNFGTAFRQRRFNSKVVDQNLFLKFCLDNWQTFGAELFRINPIAEPLKQWLEQNVDPVTKEQKFPPGVEVSPKMTVNIRKA